MSLDAHSLEQERSDILKQYRKLLRSAKDLIEDGDAKLIKKAFQMSMEAHKDMRRKSGEPYIFHPLAVAQICVDEIGLGTTSIIGALLHDVVEDTTIELKTIENLFGKKVAKIIDGLTKISEVYDYTISAQAENFRKMLLTVSEDIRVVLIKLADRLHNMRTLGEMPQEKQLKISSETLYLYAPLAHRLGLHSIKTELEDQSLRFTEPEIYFQIAKKIEKTEQDRKKFIQKFIKPIQEDLKNGQYEFEIKARTKSIYSIYNKIKKTGADFEDIYDLFAVRIIFDTPKEEEKNACWYGYSVITNRYQANPSRLKDWVTTPKSNGYKSLHTTVMANISNKNQWVEVQIRSKRMDEIAEKGIAAHWKYKGTDTRTTKNFEVFLNDLKELFEVSDKKKSAVELIEDAQSSLYTEEVFLFTPKGDLKVFPQGSVVLDFAFEIHSKLGSQCVGAKINQKLVPINHKLTTGDQVEILISPKQKPSDDWLRIVKTTKARTRIKDFLKEHNREFINAGKEIIEQKLKRLDIPALTLEITNQIRAFFNAKDFDDLFYRFGKEFIHADELKRWKTERLAFLKKQEEKLKLKHTIVDSKTFSKATRVARQGTDLPEDTLLIGDDAGIFEYKLSECCHPISGDIVFGFVTTNEGIKIHRTNCPNATELLSKHGNRVIKAQWASQKDTVFEARIMLKGTDRLGLVNIITNIISSDLKTNITTLNFSTKEGIFKGVIEITVEDTVRLLKLIQELQKIDGIEEVLRDF